MNPRPHRLLACVAILAVLALGRPARADSAEAARSARSLRTTGIVFLSIAGTLAIASIAMGGASYYYNTDNHWQNGNEDTGPAFGGVSGGLGLAAFTMMSIGAPMAAVGAEREKRARRVDVRASLTGLSVRF